MKLSVIAGAASFLIGSAVLAAPLLNADFEGQSPGLAPFSVAGSQVAGGISTYPTQVETFSTPTDFSIAASGGGSPLSMGSGNFLVFDNINSGANGRFRFIGAAGDAATAGSGQFIVSFDFIIDEASNSRIDTRLKDGSGSNFLLLQLDVRDEGGDSRNQIKLLDESNGFAQIFGTMSDAFNVGEVNTLSFVFDYGNDPTDDTTLNVLLNGSAFATDIGNSEGIAVDFGFGGFETTTNGVTVAGFDNISIVIPEPSTMTLAGLGVLALLRRKC